VTREGGIAAAVNHAIKRRFSAGYVGQRGPKPRWYPIAQIRSHRSVGRTATTIRCVNRILSTNSDALRFSDARCQSGTAVNG
jgi:hypothetical protein